MATGSFSLRKDRNGFRPIYNLGNEGGACPYGCVFCDVGRSPKVSTEDNLQEFKRQHEEFLHLIEGPYHPLIYNQGNVTNRHEFSKNLLEFILKAFNGDPRVVFVSINSRQRFVTNELLAALVALELSFPIHFIFGIESFSQRSAEIFGKNTSGEFDRFIETLRPVNQEAHHNPSANYKFGLDVNLVILPEMYLPEGTHRAGNEAKVVEGMRWEMEQLLSRIDPLVPVEINLHPFYRVDGLPYEDMDVDVFMQGLPALQAIVDEHNQSSCGRETHLFVGLEGRGYGSSLYQEQLSHWRRSVEIFNATGVLSFESLLS